METILKWFFTVMGGIVAIAATTAHISKSDTSGWSWKCAMWAVMAVAFVWRN